MTDHECILALAREFGLMQHMPEGLNEAILEAAKRRDGSHHRAERAEASMKTEHELRERAEHVLELVRASARVVKRDARDAQTLSTIVAICDEQLDIPF